MNAFQWVALPILAFLWIGSTVSFFRGQGRRRVALFWAGVWLAAGVSIYDPDLTRRLAGLLGIARGADLVSYASVLAMIIGFFMIYVRFRRLEATITKLTRHLALQNPLPPGESSHEHPPNPHDRT